MSMSFEHRRVHANQIDYSIKNNSIVGFHFTIIKMIDKAIQSMKIYLYIKKETHIKNQPTYYIIDYRIANRYQTASSVISINFIYNMHMLWKYLQNQNRNQPKEIVKPNATKLNCKNYKMQLSW